MLRKLNFASLILISQAAIHALRYNLWHLYKHKPNIL